MNISPPFEGGCECGAVRYQVTCEPTVIYACHCTICQTQSGSAFGMAMRIPKDHFVLTNLGCRCGRLQPSHGTGRSLQARMGRLADAKTALREALRMNPQFTLGAVERYPNCRDGDYVALVKQGLRDAGLPG